MEDDFTGTGSPLIPRTMTALVLMPLGPEIGRHFSGKLEQPKKGKLKIPMARALPSPLLEDYIV